MENNYCVHYATRIIAGLSHVIKRPAMSFQRASLGVLCASRRVGCRPSPRAAGLGTTSTHDAPYRSAQDLHQPLPAGPRQTLRKTPLHRLKPAETFSEDRTSTSKENSPQKPMANTDREGAHHRGATCPRQTPTGPKAGSHPRAPGLLACLNQEHPVSVCHPSAWSAQRFKSQPTGSTSRPRQMVHQDAQRGPAPGTTRGHEQAATR